MQQILLTLISFFFGARHSQSDLGIGAVKILKDTVRAEISAALFKALAGIVLSAVTIFSFIQFGRALQALFKQYAYGLQFEIITFAVITLVAAISLFVLFKERRPITQPQAQAHHGIDFESLITQFTEGLAKGYQSTPAPSSESSSQPNDTSNNQAGFQYQSAFQKNKSSEVPN